jgi:hypothetical protein
MFQLIKYYVLLYFFLSFRLGNMVAMFKYSSVTTYTVSVPPQKLEFSGAMKQECLLKETENVCSIFRHFHVDIS